MLLFVRYCAAGARGLGRWQARDGQKKRLRKYEEYWITLILWLAFLYDLRIK